MDVDSLTIEGAARLGSAVDPSAAVPADAFSAGGAPLEGASLAG